MMAAAVAEPERAEQAETPEAVKQRLGAFAANLLAETVSFGAGDGAAALIDDRELRIGISRS